MYGRYYDLWWFLFLVTNYLQNINFDMPVQRYLCPDHSDFALGTFFVAVRAANLRDTAYYFEVSTEDIPFLHVPYSNFSCTDMPYPPPSFTLAV